MLASTLLSAATALFFLPSVFSAPIAPATSVAVPEVDTNTISTTISTTRGSAIQKVTVVFLDQKSKLDETYTNLMNTDTSKIDKAFVTELCGHVSGVLRDTINGVQAATTTIEDSVAVEVSVEGLVEAIAGLIATVFRILGHVVMIVDDVLAEILPIVASVLVVVIDLLKVVGSLVAGILVLVGEVVVKVEGVVDLLKALVAYDLTYVTFIVGFMGIKLN